MLGQKHGRTCEMGWTSTGKAGMVGGSYVQLYVRGGFWKARHRIGAGSEGGVS